MGRGFSIIGLISSIVALALGATTYILHVSLLGPGIVFLGLLFPIIAIVFGAIGIVKNDPNGLARAGLSCGIVSLVLWILILIFVVYLRIG